MSNYQGIKQEIRNYLVARVPLIVVDTPERERAERILRELAEELSSQISYYTDARQVEQLGRCIDGGESPAVTGEFSLGLWLAPLGYSALFLSLSGRKEGL